MSNILHTVRELGGLHDSRVTLIKYETLTGDISIQLKDIYSNFFGLDEYKGPVGGAMLFTNGKKIQISLPDDRGIKVYEINLSETGGEYTFEVMLSPGGFIKGTASKIRLCDMNGDDVALG